MARPVWLNAVERDAWIEKHCRVCFQIDEATKRITGDGPGCGHLARAEAGQLPRAWKLRRDAVMGETYRCEDFADRPPVNRRRKSDEQTPAMLDVEPDDYTLVPVDGWPDFKAEARKQKGGDHQ